MSITIVSLLLFIAIGLVLIEIFIVPGIGIPGVIGAILMVVSLVMAYQIDTTTGHYFLAGTGLLSIGLFALAFRAKTWERLSQKEEISGRVVHEVDELKVGDTGIATSRLNPIGKAMFNEKLYEVSSKSAYIDAQSTIEIVNIEGNKITVVQKL